MPSKQCYRYFVFGSASEQSKCLKSAYLKIQKFVCSGPKEPEYPATCCYEFVSGLTCEASFGNILGTEMEVPDMYTCQELCQVHM
jgi:hypothetical protein